MRDLHLELFQEPTATYQGLMLVPSGTDASSRQQLEFTIPTETGPIQAGAIHDGNRQRMLRVNFRARSQVQNAPLCISDGGRNHLADSGLAVGKGAGLVEDNCVQTGHGLEVRTPFDK